MGDITARDSFAAALQSRVLSHFSATSENRSLAKFNSDTWQRIWQMSGHPNFRTGALLGLEDGPAIVTRARLDEAVELVSAPHVCGGLKRWKPFHSKRPGTNRTLLSNTIAFECMLRGEPGRLNSLGIELLEEVVGGQVNAFQYAAALGSVECFSVLLRRLGVTSPLLVDPDGKLNSEVLCCCDARFPFGNREGILSLLLEILGQDSFVPADLQVLTESASFFGAPWLISFVQKVWPKLDKRYLEKSLRIAAAWGHTDCARLLLEFGTDVNAMDKFRQTALMLASPHADCVRLLLEHGADAETERVGTTALGFACGSGSIACIRSLLEHGVDPKNDLMGLTNASLRGHVDVVRLLIEHGVDVNAKDRLCETALIQASRNGHTDCARLLLEHGADVNAAIFLDGRTALIQASLYGHTACARLLLEHGADVNAKLGKVLAGLFGGDTALRLATKKGHTEIVSLLRKHK